MTQTAHTPWPWKRSTARKSSNYGGYICHITATIPDPCNADGECNETVAKITGGVLDTKEKAEANAHFIVTACNAHDRLVRFIESLTESNGPYPYLDNTSVVRDARAILAEVKP